MFQLMAYRNTARPSVLRALITRVSATVAEYRNPTPQAAAPIVATPVVEADPVVLPAVDDIEQAARSYFRAADQARSAERAKRAAKKILDKVPVGRFGGWLIEREPSARQTVDLEQVRATYKRLGLGEVPMKTSAPSLKVSRVALDLNAETVEAELNTLAGAR